jgi:hypothetical protein
VGEGAQRLLAELCADLRLLWTQAGGPSLRALESQIQVSKSQVGAILNGRVRRPPDWRVVSGLVRAVCRHAQAHGRMERVSLRTGLDEYWRPRYAVLEHAFSRSTEDGAGASDASDAAPVEPSAPPGLLPSAVADFTGRRDAVRSLDALIPGDDDVGARIALICGTAGVGKTALAVHWAHRVRDEFPDGQLYVNLRGFDPVDAPLAPATALRLFLDALGVPAARIPDGVDAMGGLLRGGWPAGGSWSCWTTPTTSTRCGRCCPPRPAASSSSPAATSWPGWSRPRAPAS